MLTAAQLRRRLLGNAIDLGRFCGWGLAEIRAMGLSEFILALEIAAEKAERENPR